MKGKVAYYLPKWNVLGLQSRWVKFADGPQLTNGVGLESPQPGPIRTLAGNRLLLATICFLVTLLAILCFQPVHLPVL